ncbi:MAG: hypothetical protein HYS13_03405 [Planctomycetia bacterium]|nr:hypothetical protein [Planctomycetia bacterium]
MSRSSLLAVVGLAVFLLPCAPAFAQRQQVTATTPFGALNDNFFERIGVSAQFNGPGFFFRMGGFNNAIPQFGGFQPGVGLIGGFARVNPGGISGQFGFEFSQGRRTSFVSQTPSITLMNGQSGIISDTSQSPFVISYRPPMLPQPKFGIPWRQQLEGEIPRQTSRDDAEDSSAAASDAPDDVHPLARQLRTSSAGPTQSVADIRRQKESEREVESAQRTARAQKFLDAARQARADGKDALARKFLEKALPLAEGDLKDAIANELSKLMP